MSGSVGTNASELLSGTNGNDVINGLGGNDSLRGGDGNDVYVFSGAFGRDEVYDTSGADQVRVAADYGPQDFRLVLSSGDLAITQVNGPQVIILDTSGSVRFGGIESVLFERTGTVWDVASGAVFGTVGLRGTDAGEFITGSVYDDGIIGLGGNDTLRGDDGNDVYGFGGAFGRDEIYDTSGVDTVLIGLDYSERDFRASLSSGDLVITQVNGPQAIILDTSGSVRLGGIDSVLFQRTGVVWDVSSGQVVVRPGVFDYDGYLSANPDVRATGADPYAHYISTGWREGRDPSARFDTTFYLAKNPDVAASGANPLLHYVTAGQFEGRATNAAVGPALDARGFDATFYRLAYPDVGLAGVDPEAHYSATGWREGRNPNSLFDTNYYLTRYPDVRAGGTDPLTHYSTAGWREGRDPSAAFDTTAYLAANRDVAAAGVNPLLHYLTSGLYEGRPLGDVGIA